MNNEWVISFTIFSLVVYVEYLLRNHLHTNNNRIEKFEYEWEKQKMANHIHNTVNSRHRNLFRSRHIPYRNPHLPFRSPTKNKR